MPKSVPVFLPVRKQTTTATRSYCLHICKWPRAGVLLTILCIGVQSGVIRSAHIKQVKTALKLLSRGIPFVHRAGGLCLRVARCVGVRRAWWYKLCKTRSHTTVTFQTSERVGLNLVSLLSVGVVYAKTTCCPSSDRNCKVDVTKWVAPWIKPCCTCVFCPKCIVVCV